MLDELTAKANRHVNQWKWTRIARITRISFPVKN